MGAFIEKLKEVMIQVSFSRNFSHFGERTQSRRANDLQFVESEAKRPLFFLLKALFIFTISSDMKNIANAVCTWGHVE